MTSKDSYQGSSEHEEDKQVKRPAALQSFWIYWNSVGILGYLYIELYGLFLVEKSSVIALFYWLSI